MNNARRRLPYLIVFGLAAVAAIAWWQLRPSGLPEGFASGNGRIEATEVDVATKLAGRIASIDVDEGDFVEPGQVLARMDTQVLEAQLAQARAQLRQAENGQVTAASQISLRESEKRTAEAVVRQRQAELDAARKRHARSATLVKRNALAQQQLDDDLARLQSAEAALAAARAQVSSAEAGIAADLLFHETFARSMENLELPEQVPALPAEPFSRYQARYAIAPQPGALEHGRQFATLHSVVLNGAPLNVVSDFVAYETEVLGANRGIGPDGDTALRNGNQFRDGSDGREQLNADTANVLVSYSR